MEKEFACWTGAQLNRGGASSSDPDMTDTAESFGLPMGADFYVVAVTSDELKKMGQYKLKQLKNRYAGTGVHTTFGLGVDIQKQRLYDLDSSDSFNQSSKPSNLIPSKGQTFIQDKEFEGFGIKT